MAPAWGIVDASMNVSSAGLTVSADSAAIAVFGEAALQREVVAIHLVTRPESTDLLADGVDPPRDVRAERPTRRSAQSTQARHTAASRGRHSQSLRLTDVAATLTSTCPAPGDGTGTSSTRSKSGDPYRS